MARGALFIYHAQPAQGPHFNVEGRAPWQARVLALLHQWSHSGFLREPRRPQATPGFLESEGYNFANHTQKWPNKDKKATRNHKNNQTTTQHKQRNKRTHITNAKQNI